MHSNPKGAWSVGLEDNLRVDSMRVHVRPQSAPHPSHTQGPLSGERFRAGQGRQKDTAWHRFSYMTKGQPRQLNELRDAPTGPAPPRRFRMQRCTAEAVEPRPGGETSRIMIAAGARHDSDRANPTSRAANDCWYSGARKLTEMMGAASSVAPACRTKTQVLAVYVISLCSAAESATQAAVASIETRTAMPKTERK